jgi:hypothetical protein
MDQWNAKYKAYLVAHYGEGTGNEKKTVDSVMK